MKMIFDISPTDLSDEMLDEIEGDVWANMMTLPTTSEGKIDIFSRSDNDDHGFCLDIRKEIQKTLCDLWDISSDQIEESIYWCDGLLKVLNDCENAVNCKRGELVNLLNNSDRNV